MLRLALKPPHHEALNILIDGVNNAGAPGSAPSTQTEKRPTHAVGLVMEGRALTLARPAAVVAAAFVRTAGAAGARYHC